MLIQEESSKYSLQTLGISEKICATQQHTAAKGSCFLLPTLFQSSHCILRTSYWMLVIGVSQLSLLNWQENNSMQKISFLLSELGQGKGTTMWAQPV